MTKKFGLSKSKVSAFEQCPKRLWLQTHMPDEATIDEDAEARFATGNAVGDLACSLLPEGVMVAAEPNLTAALETTASLLEAGHKEPIFEATFGHDGVLIRADVMEHRGEDGWHVAEVKSSAGVKDYHLGDMATQLWVMRQAGVRIASAAIRHIDTSFELQEPQAYEGLLKDTLVGDEVDAVSNERDVVIDAARKMLNGEEPSIEMGTQCTKPFDCEFQSYCLTQSDVVVADWPISLLPRTGKRIAASYAELGIYDLKDVPTGELTHKNHEKIRLATVNDRPFHDVDAIVEETDEWAFPLIHLDFETCNLAIPRWVGTRPYQQVPFQFSAHIEAEDGSIEHREFLNLSGNDPRLACAAALAELPASGSVVTWNASFERNCLKALAQFSPEHSEAMLSLADRVVDLKVIAEKHYYHRDQRGSWSIKNVLPTLASELDYGTLEVKAGGDAIEAYKEAVAENTSAERQEVISEGLLAYCERDSWAMVVLLRKLRTKSESLDRR